MKVAKPRGRTVPNKQLVVEHQRQRAEGDDGEERKSAVGRLLLALLIGGLILSYPSLASPRGLRQVFRRSGPARWHGAGRYLLLVSAVALAGMGLAIMGIGASFAFVPTDLDYVGTQAKAMAEWNLRSVPVIAHDRAGFGGGLTSWGIVLAMIAWCAHRVSERLLWWTLAISGLLAFGLVTLIHVVIGYTSFVHLLPIYAIAFLYCVGLLLIRFEEASSGASLASF